MSLGRPVPVISKGRTIFEVGYSNIMEGYKKDINAKAFAGYKAGMSVVWIDSVRGDLVKQVISYLNLMNCKRFFIELAARHDGSYDIALDLAGNSHALDSTGYAIFEYGKRVDSDPTREPWTSMHSLSVNIEATKPK